MCFRSSNLLPFTQNIFLFRCDHNKNYQWLADDVRPNGLRNALPINKWLTASKSVLRWQDRYWFSACWPRLWGTRRSVGSRLILSGDIILDLCCNWFGIEKSTTAMQDANEIYTSTDVTISFFLFVNFVPLCIRRCTISDIHFDKHGVCFGI